jgi:3-hydroxymyristoyl/3-hydroxydecanoyl-(acyl carrier protein) dehydratase
MSEAAWWDQIPETKVYEKSDIDSLLPHRGDMSFLNRVFEVDAEHVIGEILLTEKDFWAPGHFPPQPVTEETKFPIGPIFPGVLMVESAAQLGIVFWRVKQGIEESAKRTMLFKEIEKASFKREARPGDRILIRCNFEKSSLRLMKCNFEGVVIKSENEVFPCFECRITGLSV